MKLLKRIVTALMLLLFVSTAGICVFASENSGSFLVTYHIDEQTKYPIDIIVGEGGILYEGNQQIASGKTTYEQALGRKRSFTIAPKNGYEINQISYHRPEFNDTRDITGDVKDSVIEISNESTRIQVTFEFKQQKSSSSIISPITGEDDLLLLMSMYSIVALFVLFLIWTSYKEQQKKKENQE